MCTNSVPKAKGENRAQKENGGNSAFLVVVLKYYFPKRVLRLLLGIRGPGCEEKNIPWSNMSGEELN